MRIAFKDSAGIAVPTQSIFYEPWGLSMKGMQITRNLTNFNRNKMNGKEEQNDFGLNTVDLGWRMYMPDIGRNKGIDSLGEMYKNESLYSASGNNPISNIDAEGAFKIDAEFARKYPTLTRILAHYLPQVANNKQVVSYFMRQYNLSEKQVTENFEFGKGPWITPTQEFSFGEDMQNPMFTNFSGLYAPEYGNGIYKDNLFINSSSVLDLLEQSFKSQNSNNLGARMFETTVTILHEYAHYLNVKTNKNWKQIEERSEQGALFEKKNFQQFSYTNDNGGFGAYQKYYNQNANSRKMAGMTLSSQAYFNTWFLISSPAPNAQKATKKAKGSGGSALGGANDSN